MTSEQYPQPLFTEFDDKYWWNKVIDLDLADIDVAAVRANLKIDEIESWDFVPKTRFALEEQRAFIYVRDKGECGYCKYDVDPRRMHADHLTPYSKGGLTVVENLICSCRFCNVAKGASTPEEYLENLQKYGKEWAMACYYRSAQQRREEQGI